MDAERNQLSGYETECALIEVCIPTLNTISKYAQIWQTPTKVGGTNSVIGRKTSMQVMSLGVDINHDA